MKCRHARKLLSRYTSDELIARHSYELEVHLSACRACRRDLGAHRRAEEALTALGLPEEPPDLRDDLRQRIQTRQRHPLPWAWAGVAAVAAVLLWALVPPGKWRAPEPGATARPMVAIQSPTEVFQPSSSPNHVTQVDEFGAATRPSDVPVVETPKPRVVDRKPAVDDVAQPAEAAPPEITGAAATRQAGAVASPAETARDVPASSYYIEVSRQGKSSVLAGAVVHDELGGTTEIQIAYDGSRPPAVGAN